MIFIFIRMVEKRGHCDDDGSVGKDDDVDDDDIVDDEVDDDDDGNESRAV